MSASKVVKGIGIGVGVLLGVAHIGALGHLIKTNETYASRPQYPAINIPDGKYTSYEVDITKDGYRIRYKANDPKVLSSEREMDSYSKKKGLFGGGTSIRQEYRKDEYTMEGSRNLNGGTLEDEGKISAKQLECIKAQGGAESQGAQVGSSLATGLAAPALVSIPYVGWLAAGWATLLGQKVGTAAGAGVGSMFNDCEDL